MLPGHPFMKSVLSLGCLLFVCSPTFGREWHDAGRKHVATGEFVSLKNGVVTLSRKGREFEMTLHQFCAEDRVYIANRTKTSLAREFPAHLSTYELSTRETLLYARLVSRLNTGSNLAKWPLLAEAHAALRDYVGNALDAPAIAATLNSSFPAGGVRFEEFDQVVKDCSRILNMESPDVFYNKSPETEIYVRGVEHPHLIVTAGLLRTFQNTPDELRFLIGRELGRIKTQQLQFHDVGLAVFRSLRNADLTKVPLVGEPADAIKKVMMPVMFGHFLSLCREAEIVADRAGLVCCQDIQVAYDAICRMNLGLEQSLPWFDRKNPHFDANAVLRSYQAFENRPLVAFLRDLHAHGGETPFLPDRIAALRIWHDEGGLDRVLAEKHTAGGNFNGAIAGITLEELADTDADVDPYVIVYNDKGEELARTPYKSKTKSPAWTDVLANFQYEFGRPIYFEIWDSNSYGTTAFDSVVGMFVVQPRRGQSDFKDAIYWSLKDRNTTTRAGFASVRFALSSSN
jgi:hypothetical protein